MRAIETLLKELTIEEKVALLEGYQSWMTNPVPRLGIPSAYLTDGPVGVRKKVQSEAGGAVGLGTAYPATAFPTSVAIANSWDCRNAEKMGHAIGQECIHYDVDVLLAPALNLKRDPRCGRNFEYYSEDPLLAGKMAAAFTRGVQSTGTAACAKHFAMNNCETFRHMSDSVADERAARELYLRAFEICVKEGRPRTMMCSYNKVNGEFGSQNRWLIRDLLRGEWGYEGLMMTDWGATEDRVAGVKAGMDLDMPGNVWHNRRAIVEAAEDGRLPIETLDEAVRHVLRLVESAKGEKEQIPEADTMFRDNHALAVELACEGAVLLQNDGVLPLQCDAQLTVIGELFDIPRYQGAGSSGMNPTQLISPRNAFDAAGIGYTYLPGYRESSGESDDALEAAALNAAEKSDVVLFFGGLTELFESEGFDRKDLVLPACQLRLLERLTKRGKKVVAVLFGGSPFEMPFADGTNAILHMFLPGQGGGEACRKLLYGEVNPSGKLSETWMRTTEDIPFGSHFGKHKVVPYWENIFMGYRYFDLCPEKIRYPFGHGLSYTAFAYSDLQISEDGNEICAELTVTNTGDRDGAEVVQLYAGANDNTLVFKAQKALKAFEKVSLRAGESRRICLRFLKSELSYYNTREHSWVLENGSYDILVGASSRDIRLRGSVNIAGQPQIAGQYSEAVLESYRNITVQQISEKVFCETICRPLPPEPPAQPFTVETPVCEFRATRSGRLLYALILKIMELQGGSDKKLPEGPEKEALRRSKRFTLSYIPLASPRSLVQSGGGLIQMNVGRAFPMIANGHWLQAIKELLKKEKKIPLPSEKDA